MTLAEQIAAYEAARKAMDAAWAGVLAAIKPATPDTPPPPGVPYAAAVLPSGRFLKLAAPVGRVVTGFRYPGPAAASAAFLAADTPGGAAPVLARGADGLDAPGAPSPPGYAVGSCDGKVYTWAAATTDPRGVGGKAAAWFAAGPLNYTLNCQDTAPHRVTLYSVDWDGKGTRAMSVSVLDDRTGAVLDGPRPVASFSGGVWLSWAVTGNVRFVLKPTSGNAVLSAVYFDGGGSAVRSWPVSVRVNGGPATPLPYPWTDPDGKPFVLFALPAQVKPGDVVTWSAPPGVILAGADGNAGAADAPVTNLAGRDDYLPEPAGPHAMRAGYQDSVGTYWRPGSFYSNHVKRAAADYGGFWGPMARGVDENGYAPNETVEQTVLVNQDGPGVGDIVSAPYVGFPLGRAWLRWSGPGSCRVLPLNTTTAKEVSRQTVGGVTVVGYEVSRTGGKPNAELRVGIAATAGGKAVSGLALFDASVADPFNPPLYHPKTLVQYEGARLLRNKDYFPNDVQSNVVDPDDCPTPDWVTSQRSPAKYTVAFSRVEPYATGQPWNRTGRWAVRVVFPRPHPFKAGQIVQFGLPDGKGGYTTSVAWKYADGTTAAPVQFSGQVYPVDATSVVVPYACADKPITPFDADGRTRVLIAGCPPDDLAARCAAVHPDCSPWVCMPYGASDALAYDWGVRSAKTKSTAPLLVEYTNEWWNGGPGFPQYYHLWNAAKEYAATAADASWRDPASPVNAWYYAMRSGQLFRQFEAGFVAGGGDPNRLRQVYNVQFADSGTTKALLDFAARTGERPDVLAAAPYLVIGPRDPAVPPEVCDALDVHQAADLAEVAIEHYDLSRESKWLAAHEAVVKASAFPAIAWAAYEGGYECVRTNGTQAKLDRLTVALWGHPRMRRAALGLLDWYDRRGWFGFTNLGGCDLFVREGGAVKGYPKFVGLGQPAGDGVANLPAITGNDPPDPTRLVSVIGRAVNDWSGEL